MLQPVKIANPFAAGTGLVAHVSAAFAPLGPPVSPRVTGDELEVTGLPNASTIATVGCTRSVPAPPTGCVVNATPAAAPAATSNAALVPMTESVTSIASSW